jgi:CheY-like chemotaxis protein
VLILKILIVDDEKDTLLINKKIFENLFEDSEIHLATNGQEAVDKHKELKNELDLIIMDHKMPIKDGISAMIEILSISPNLKIIINSCDKSIKNKALKNGALFFIEKPYKIKDLFEQIMSCEAV